MKNQSVSIWIWCIVALFVFQQCDSKSSEVSPSTTGIGGSLARFAIAGNSLYIATKHSLDVYDVSNPQSPIKIATNNLGVGIETIFPYQSYLFIGANDGMYIFDNKILFSPKLITKYTHVMSCDPVVVQGSYAYVTLRSGTNCRFGGGGSSLDVVDISNINAPKLIHSQALNSPYGLGVDDDKLFVCEGENGLKIFDITDPKKPVLKKTLADVLSYDVIPNQKILIITGEKGISQYRYDSNETFEFLSKIVIE